MDNNTQPIPSIPEESVVIPNISQSPTVPNNTSTSKPKRPTAKIIATLFGILVLVGATIAGVVVVSNQNNKQLINQQAIGGCDPNKGETTCNDSCGFRCVAPPNTCASTCQSATNPPGNGGNNCSPSKLDVNNQCNDACCGSAGDCPSGQQCNIGNAFCKSGSSCNPNSGGGVHKTCSGGTCANEPCPGNASSCADTCTTNPQCANVGPVCGNGTCESGETQANCPSDCRNGQGGNNWSYAGNCVQVTSGTVDIQRFSGSSCPTTQNSSSPQSVGVGTYCPTPSQGSCQQIDVVGSGQGVCSCDTSTAPPATTPPTTAPTATTAAITASCTNLKAYSTTWILYSAADLAKLKPGDKVRFAVTGTTTGSFSKARFTVNNETTKESQLKKPGDNATYYYEYTIPAATTSFSVTSQLYSSDLQQWF